MTSCRAGWSRSSSWLIVRPDKKVTVKCLRERKWGADMQERKGMLEAMANEYGIGRMLNAPRANQVWWTLE